MLYNDKFEALTMLERNTASAKSGPLPPGTQSSSWLARAASRKPVSTKCSARGAHRPLEIVMGASILLWSRSMRRGA